MRRLVVLLAVGAALGAFGAVACGGGDKPPLTPDLVEPPPTDLSEAGAPAPGTSTTPAPSAPPEK